MGAIEVQLDASLVPDNHQVFKFSPGKTYRFYEALRDARMAFLDIRGLDALDKDWATWDKNEVLKIIADDRWNRELQSRARGNDPRGSEGITPTDQRTYTFLDTLLKANVGDLIVVPVQAYTKDVLIGELIDPGDKADFVTTQDGDYSYKFFGRRIRWLAAVEKRRLSGALLDKLHTQTALFVLGKTLRHEIYEHAYGDFVYDGEFVATFKVGKAKFTAEDSAVASIWFNAFEVLREAIENGSVANLPASFAQMGLEELPDNHSSVLQINVNSPGAYLLRSKGVFALALVAMFTLSACTPNEVVNDTITVKLKVVGSAPISCQHDIESSVSAMAKALGKARAEEMCKLGQRAAKDAKMRVAATLKK